MRVYLGVGSNAGDRLALLDAAVARLDDLLEDLHVSSIYETEPLYVIAQPRFLNAVVAGCTVLEPHSLLSATAAIEREFGRKRSAEQLKGPRPLDIDILLYGQHVIHSADLTVPHPGMLERRFVLEPLVEIDPSLVHPLRGTLLADELARLAPQGVYCYRANSYNRTRSEEQHR